jgi:hypothetical protein
MSILSDIDFCIESKTAEIVLSNTASENTVSSLTTSKMAKNSPSSPSRAENKERDHFPAVLPGN